MGKICSGIISKISKIPSVENNVGIFILPKVMNLGVGVEVEGLNPPNVFPFSLFTIPSCQKLVLSVCFFIYLVQDLKSKRCGEEHVCVSINQHAVTKFLIP